MKADEFEARINDLLDRRIAPTSDPEVVAWSTESDELRSILHSYLSLADVCERLPQPRPADDLAERIVRLARRAEPEAPTIPLKRPAAWKYGAAAAVILAAVTLWSLLPSGSSPQTALAPDRAPSVAQPVDQSVVASEPSDAKAPNATTADQNGGGLLAGNGQVDTADVRALTKYFDMTRQATTVLADLALMMTKIPLDGPPTPVAAAGQKEMVEHVSDGLEPVARSAASAFDFLLEVVPATADPSRS